MAATAFNLASIDAPRMNAVFAAMREDSGGVHTVDSLGTLFFRYDDVVQIFSMPEEFSSATFFDGPQSAHDQTNVKQRLAVDTVGNILLFLDAPSHTRLRSLVRHAFSAKAILL